MTTHRLLRSSITGIALVGIVYACSGTPDAVLKPQGDDGDDNGGTSGTGGAQGGSAGSVIITRGGKGGTGKGGSGKGGNGAGGQGDGGDNGLGGTRGRTFPDAGFDYDASFGGEGGACAATTGEGMLVKKPMDIIIAIDNSQSMQGEIQAVQQRINTDFANIIRASGIDFRVIMVSRYGNVFINNFDGGAASDSAYSICVGNPLSTITCPANANATTPPVANNAPTFYHHSTDIGSNNMWCRLLRSYDTTDPSPNPRTNWTAVAPQGWGAFLRPQAFKVFIGITDDSPNRSGVTASRRCDNMRPGDGLVGSNDATGANNFDNALRILAPNQFGAMTGARNYVWYAINGFAGNNQTNPTPLASTDPVVTTCCTAAGGVQNNCQGDNAPAGDGAGPGQGYQYLAIQTGGLRYPSCYNSNFNAIFNAIAQGVIDRAGASCEYAVPPNPNGVIDPRQTKVSYQAGGTGTPTELTRVGSAASCTAGASYYFSPGFDRVFLCPAACTTVQADPMAKISITFGCEGS